MEKNQFTVFVWWRIFAIWFCANSIIETRRVSVWLNARLFFSKKSCNRLNSDVKTQEEEEEEEEEVTVKSVLVLQQQ